MKKKTTDAVDQKSSSKRLLILAAIFAGIAVIATLAAVLIPDTNSQNKEKPLRLTFEKQGSAVISAPDGTPKASYELEIAETMEQQKTGLMYRDAMAPNQGMLFVYPAADKMNFWMKNTYLPLDIVFFLPDSTIYKVYPDNVPFSETGISPAQDCIMALELNAGQAKAHNLAPGDKLFWKRTK